MNRQAQTKLIETHLSNGNSITPLEALKKFNCMRLSARIHELRHKFGYNIKRTMIRDVSNSYASYSLIQE